MCCIFFRRLNQWQLWEAIVSVQLRMHSHHCWPFLASLVTFHWLHCPMDAFGHIQLHIRRWPLTIWFRSYLHQLAYLKCKYYEILTCSGRQVSQGIFLNYCLFNLQNLPEFSFNHTFKPGSLLQQDCTKYWKKNVTSLFLFV